MTFPDFLRQLCIALNKCGEASRSNKYLVKIFTTSFDGRKQMVVEKKSRISIMNSTISFISFGFTLTIDSNGIQLIEKKQKKQIDVRKALFFNNSIQLFGEYIFSYEIQIIPDIQVECKRIAFNA